MLDAALQKSVSLIDCILSTGSQAYTNLQSLVLCLDHRMLHHMQYAVKQGLGRLRDALESVSGHRPSAIALHQRNTADYAVCQAFHSLATAPASQHRENHITVLAIPPDVP